MPCRRFPVTYDSPFFNYAPIDQTQHLDCAPKNSMFPKCPSLFGNGVSGRQLARAQYKSQDEDDEGTS